jgi:hypothetical protein
MLIGTALAESVQSRSTAGCGCRIEHRKIWTPECEKRLRLALPHREPHRYGEELGKRDREREQKTGHTELYRWERTL